MLQDRDGENIKYRKVDRSMDVNKSLIVNENFF
jgi:hypothetical protein